MHVELMNPFHNHEDEAVRLTESWSKGALPC